jgi:TetR/AcrR family transcriptional repressor of lmrAB and yxaGH operons
MQNPSIQPVRQQIIETACDLMENQGYHATGLNQIVAESGAPKGSLYYYFPEGKEELAEHAIRHASGVLVERIQISLSLVGDPAESLREFIHNLADTIEASGFRSGSHLSAVAMETANTSPRINLACREAFTQIQIAFDEKLIESGFSTESANRLATLITATIDGGIILCRTYHNSTPLRQVGDQLAELVAAANNRTDKALD